MFLTGNELEVLRGLANGRRSRCIAATLGRSHATVETYVKELLLKFRARTRAHLVIIALREGAISRHDIEVPQSAHACDNTFDNEY